MQVFHTCHIIISCKCTLWSYSTYLLYFTQQKEIGTGANSTVCMVDTNRLNSKIGMVTKCYIGYIHTLKYLYASLHVLHIKATLQ